MGQLIADSIRLYGEHFWTSLALGVGPAALTVIAVRVSYGTWIVLMMTLGGLVLSASYVGAVALAGGVRRDRRLLTALLAGVLAFAPVPILLFFFILPALAWLALVGLVVPAVLIEHRSLGDAFRRALQLGRADFVHALGSLATLVIVVLLSLGVLVFLIKGAGDQTVGVAVFLGNLVLSPLLFLGSALLYFDQAARQHGERGQPVPPR